MTNQARIDDLPQQSANRHCGVTELVLTREAPEQLTLLLPMIAYLSHQGSGATGEERWITWIAPRHITRQSLEAFGVDTRRVRLIHCQDAQQSLWITWEALAAGNSHTVIASPGRLTERELAQLELAAQQGGCQGLLLRVR